jgi:hypothetical protein
MAALVVGSEVFERAIRRAGGNASSGLVLFDRGTAAVQRRYAPAAATPMLIEGRSPRVGLSLVFGKGGIRKTMLVIDRFVHIAGFGPNRPTHWKGFEIKRRGWCVIYTAEDQIEAIDQRIWDVIVHDLGMDPASDDALETRSRITVVAPLSMTRDEFPFANPQLFRHDRKDDTWKPNEKGEAVFDNVAACNEGLEPDDENRIVAIALDSITSVCGFELTDNDAASNFTYWVNQRSIEHDVSVIGIAHSPKSNAPSREDPEAGSADRLAGGFAWSTNVRITEEVRIPVTRGVSGVKRVPDEWWETQGLPAEHAHAIVVQVAKANLLDASREKVWLSPRARGGFKDVSACMRGRPRTLAEWKIRGGEGVLPGSSAAMAAPAVDSRRKAKNLIARVLEELVLDRREKDDMLDRPVARRKAITKKELVERLRVMQALKAEPVLGMTPSAGGIDFNEGRGRPNSITADLEALKSEGRVLQVTGGWDVPMVINGSVGGEEKDR